MRTDWLEVGCATGAHMRIMEAAGQRCGVGVDVSLDAVRSAERACVATATALPFRGLSFGGTTTSGTLMHVGPWEVLPLALAELARVARDWLLFVEVHKPRPMVLDYADLMPKAWVYPWGIVVPQLLKDWRKVDGMTLVGTEERYDRVDVVLLRRQR